MRTNKDLEILEQIVNKETGYIINQRTNVNWLKKRGYYDYLLDRYDDNTTDSLSEIIHRLVHDIEVVPKCKMCGNPIKFNIHNREYYRWCSIKCRNNDPEVKKKNAEAVSKYRKWEYANKKEEVMAKKAATLKEHYGEYSNGSPFCCKAVNNKVKRIFNERYGTDNYIFSDEQRKAGAETLNNKRRAKWKSRGFDVDYTDHKSVIVHNGCPIHGDFELSVWDFNNRMKPSRREYSTVCPLCNPINYYSGKELAVKEHLDSIGVFYIEHNKTLIKPLELDFYIESANIAIEVDGVYYFLNVSSIYLFLYFYSRCKDTK